MVIPPPPQKVENCVLFYTYYVIYVHFGNEKYKKVQITEFSIGIETIGTFFPRIFPLHDFGPEKKV